MVDYTTTDLVHLSPANAIMLGQWYHVLLTWDGSTAATNARIYVNGTEVTNYATTTPGVGTRVGDEATNLTIGNESVGARTFGGMLDDVRVYNRVLTAAEITAIYRAGL